MICLKRFLSSAAICLCACILAFGQTKSKSDSVPPIAKYLASGNAEALSAWFAENLEISILGRTTAASKEQARRIIKSFFSKYSPRDYQITHTAGKPEMKYVLGDLSAGGETFHLTIFLNCRGESFEIEQFKVDRL